MFYNELVSACRTSGYKCGVYSNENHWKNIFGNHFIASYVSELPLWYSHYDKRPSFSDFRTFGGWPRPWAKQYLDD